VRFPRAQAISSLKARVAVTTLFRLRPDLGAAKLPLCRSCLSQRAANAAEVQVKLLQKRRLCNLIGNSNSEHNAGIQVLNTSNFPDTQGTIAPTEAVSSAAGAVSSRSPSVRRARG